jgi:hypothetical protein
MIVHFPGVSIIPLSTIFEWIWELFRQSGILFPFYRVFSQIHVTTQLLYLNMIGYFIIFDFDGSGDTENRQGI